MSMKGQCVECGEQVNTYSRDFYRQVVGWELTRKHGGANAIKNREVTGQVMHYSCMTKKQQVIGQEAMFT